MKPKGGKKSTVVVTVKTNKMGGKNPGKSPKKAY